MKKLIFILAVLSFGFKGLCQQESRNSRGYANYLLIPSSYIQAHDDKFTGSLPWINGFSNTANKVIVELGLDEDRHLAHSSAIKICAKFDLQLTDSSLAVTTLTAQQLDISYDPADLSRYKDKAQIIFPNFYKAKVYNVTISYCSSTVSCGSCSTPYTFSDVYLQASIESTRTYTFGFSTSVSNTDIAIYPIPVSTATEQVTLAWPFILGATEYELEYTFVDDYSTTYTTAVPSASLIYDLDQDATRIITPNNHYTIPLTCERGYMLYRIRPVGTNTLSQRVEGSWNATSASGTVSASACVATINPSFPYATLNWQSTKTFAESGKTGTGVEFADAVGLPRQSLARLNTEAKTIVRSSLFDFYGRPAVEILPAPVIGLDFNYRFGLNVYTTSTVFDKLIFDLTNTNSFCSPASFSLSPSMPTAGASNYYSPYNTNKEAFQGYLPDAEGYPYTQVQYTNDGLNKISRKNLPGKLHRLDLGGKATKYTYVNPEQVQLDRIFGSEAGRNNYYHRTSTIDPNGQVSLKFEDMFGRTVATCLKGLNPSNLDALPNITGTATLVETYDNAPINTADASTRCKEVNTSIEILSASGESQTFNYQATWGNAFTNSCDPSLCFHCVYDVTLSITDECGLEIFDNGGTLATPGYVGIIGRQPPYTGTLSCSQYTSAYATGVTLSGSVSVNFPGPGKYKIYKKICVNDAPLTDYVNTYLTTTTTSCLPDKCTIYNNILNQIDFSGCFPKTCSDCYLSVTSYSNIAAGNPTATMTFANQGPVGGGLAHGGEGATGNGTSQAVYTSTLTPQQLSQAYENCSIFCVSNDRCSTYERLMESDFYPGTGQFATTNTSSPTWTLSIFNPTNSLPSNPTWTTTLSYNNAAGQTEYVQINGVNKHPYELTQAQYIQYFRKSWAKAFMSHHPEACKYYFYCTMMSSSQDYDDILTSTNHSDDACVNGGYWFPVRYGSYSSYMPIGSCTSTTPGIDPITSLSYTSDATFATAISSFTNEITGNFRNSGRDIYEYTAMQLHSAIATASTGDYLGQDPCKADDDWTFFRNYYLVAKQILYQKLQTIVLASPSTFSMGSLGCIVPTPTAVVSHFPDPLRELDNEFPATGTISSSSFYTTSISPPSTTLSSSAYTLALSTYTTAMSQFTAQVSPSSTEIATQCSVACNSYTAGWDINLKATCPGYNSTLSATQGSILAAMLEVCKLGCDMSTYLMGASSTPAGTVYTLPSTSQTVTNFQQILDYYLPSGGCSQIVIDGPPSYTASSGTLSLSQLTSCKCDIILEVADEFTTTTHPAGTLEWQLFKQKYGFDLSQYYRIKCACQNAISGTWSNGYAWNSTETSALNSYTLPVDPQLACSSCLSCTEVAMAIDNLTLPISSSYTDVVSSINHIPGNQIYVKNTLNGMFGLHTLQTYLELYEDCTSFTTSATANTFTNCITPSGYDLFVYLNSIISEKSFLQTHVMTLCTDDKFYLSSLYTGTLPIIPGYTYTPTQSSNSLTIIISSTATTIASILLIKPSGYSGSWSDFIQLKKFMAYCPPPLISGRNYGFKIDAEDDLFATISLTGAVTCTAWPISNLSYGSYTVPSLCPPDTSTPKNSCVVNQINNAYTSALHQYQNQIASSTATFITAWKDYCFNNLDETFTRSFRGADEYNFTLYYYDQAGNLQRTVPPNGADPGILTTVTIAITSTVPLLPAYSGSNAVALNFVNDYKYDSYNNLLEDNSVDGGKTSYYYDPFGRIQASQNARQAAASTSTNNICSYTLYDDIGRIIETGQVHFASASSYTAIYSAAYFASAVTSTTSSLLREEVTQIYYDRPVSTSSVLATFTGSLQNNLRNRVAYVTYEDSYNSDPALYDHATYYSYDDQGNVTELVQHNKQLDVFNQGFKKINYEFELISGNMIKAMYQDNKPDQFIHKYYYDDDNRLKEVFTSKDKINWDRDAKYFYYEHGPLARVERADKKVQGTDYLYTIHGWIKAINSDALSRTSDGGKDGTTGTNYLSGFNNVHNWIAGDAMNFSLNYYNTSTTADYKAIKTFTTSDVNPLMALTSFTGSGDPFYLDNNSSNLAGDGPDLFNGNIGSMNTSFIDKDATNTITNNTPFPQLTAYRYDQLQRLTSMKSFHSYSSSALTWSAATSSTYKDDYRMNLTYDYNGNILTLLRNGPSTVIVSAASPSMDILTYGYYNSSVYSQSLSVITHLPYNSNKLRCVNDAISAGNYNTDIDDYGCTSYEFVVTDHGMDGQSIANGNRRYDYDATGNLIYDKGEYIAAIDWTVDRKVKSITRDASAMVTASVTLPDIEYAYNPQRQRVMKLVKPRDVSTKTITPVQNWVYTYYVYDAGGNVMATYNRAATTLTSTTFKDQLSLAENPIYGSARLAIARPSNTLASWTYNFSNPCDGGILDCRGAATTSASPDPTIASSGYKTERDLGYKDFELNNHQGNVVTTVSDRKIPAGILLTSCERTYDFTGGVPPFADIRDYHATVSTSSGSLVCTLQTGYGISGINPNLGNNLSSSAVYQIEFDWDPGTLTSGDGLYVQPIDYDPVSFAFYPASDFWSAGSTPVAGHYSFTYTPTYVGSNYYTYLSFYTNGSSTHYFKVDNVKMCTTGVGVITSYSADIVSNTDYYPFGQTMPGRTWKGTSDNYRYGYQNQETDQEFWNGAVSYEYRIEDPRIGRFFSVDPLAYDYPWNSPYAFSENRVIDAVELEGLEEEIAITGAASEAGGSIEAGATRVNADGSTSTFNGKGWENTPVGKSTSPANAVELPEIEVGSKGSITATRTENAAYANIDNSTRAGENNYGFDYNPNYRPTPQQQTWYDFADFANKASAIMLAGAVSLPTLLEEVPAAGSILFNKGKDEVIEAITEKPTEETTTTQEFQQPKLSKVQKSKTTESIGDGKYTKTTKIQPGKGPGQSRSEMIIYKNKQGKVIKTQKNSYDRGNKLQNTKPLRGGPEGRPAGG